MSARGDIIKEFQQSVEKQFPIGPPLHRLRGNAGLDRTAEDGCPMDSGYRNQKLETGNRLEC